MNTNTKKQFSADNTTAINAISDNIIFTVFKNKLTDLSNLIGGKNEGKISDLYLVCFDSVIEGLLTDIELKNNTVRDNIYKMLIRIFHQYINNYSFAEALSLEYQVLAIEILNEWQSSLNLLRNNLKNNQHEYTNSKTE